MLVDTLREIFQYLLSPGQAESSEHEERQGWSAPTVPRMTDQSILLTHRPEMNKEMLGRLLSFWGARLIRDPPPHPTRDS